MCKQLVLHIDACYIWYTSYTHEGKNRGITFFFLAYVRFIEITRQIIPHSPFKYVSTVFSIPIVIWLSIIPIGIWNLFTIAANKNAFIVFVVQTYKILNIYQVINMAHEPQISIPNFCYKKPDTI